MTPTIQSRLADPATRDAAIAELVAAPLRRDAPIRAVDAKAKDLTFRISTAGIDRYNSTIDPKGWKLEQYRSNPVVLWMHCSWDLPIARTKVIDVDDEGLVATPDFSDARKLYPFAGTVEDMLRAELLNASSVSWQPEKYCWNEKRGGIDYIEQSLLEWSIVTVPGNADALLQRSRAEGIDIEPMRAFAERVLRVTGSKDAEAQARAGEAPRLYVFARGDVRVEAPTAKALGRAVEALGMKRADEPAKDEPVAEPVEEPARADAEKCACGHELGADDKFCAACGEKRAEPEAEPDEKEAPAEEEVDAERVLAALSRITT